MIKMYLPNTPSRFVGNAKVIKVQKVRMTCGGGMGGASWYEYVVDFPETPRHDLVKVTNYKGEKMTLNTAYVVKVEDSQIVAITTDSKNPTFYGMKSFYYETPCDDNVILCAEYGPNELYDRYGIKFLERIDL